MTKIGWTQPLCDTCYVAWCLGRGEAPREPTRAIGGHEPDPCLICGEPTNIYTRISPKLAGFFAHPLPDSDQ
jgi:hypothetical protein